ncbi:unnamed protein product [Protopolystoma xenopodis]|uniref:Uncharacterized protein n=1 Tax=Protopolystoma xenopodis TaxID=117903 RepID=A0A3S5ALY4_9PLAT|nr:unnamed protein product [Protopolystoma xenopodis]
MPYIENIQTEILRELTSPKHPPLENGLTCMALFARNFRYFVQFRRYKLPVEMEDAFNEPCLFNLFHLLIRAVRFHWEELRVDNMPAFEGLIVTSEELLPSEANKNVVIWQYIFIPGFFLCSPYLSLTEGNSNRCETDVKTPPSGRTTRLPLSRFYHHRFHSHYSHTHQPHFHFHIQPRASAPRRLLRVPASHFHLPSHSILNYFHICRPPLQEHSPPLLRPQHSTCYPMNLSRSGLQSRQSSTPCSRRPPCSGSTEGQPANLSGPWVSEAVELPFDTVETRHNPHTNVVSPKCMHHSLIQSPQNHQHHFHQHNQNQHSRDSNNNNNNDNSDIHGHKVHSHHPYLVNGHQHHRHLRPVNYFHRDDHNQCLNSQSTNIPAYCLYEPPQTVHGHNSSSQEAHLSLPSYPFQYLPSHPHHYSPHPTLCHHGHLQDQCNHETLPTFSSSDVPHAPAIHTSTSRPESPLTRTDMATSIQELQCPGDRKTFVSDETKFHRWHRHQFLGCPNSRSRPTSPIDGLPFSFPPTDLSNSDTTVSTDSQPTFRQAGLAEIVKMESIPTNLRCLGETNNFRNLLVLSRSEKIYISKV